MARPPKSRTLAVWCPQWPVVAAGAAPQVPAVVLQGERVVACTPGAARQGVAAGQRRREAQGRCPEVVVLELDERRVERAFDAVLAVVESFTPRIEVTAPGECAIAVRGPARYFGGEEALAAQVLDGVEAVLTARGWTGAARVGIGDGPNVARLVARHLATARQPHVVAVGRSAEALAPLPVRVLDAPEVTDVLVRLGLRTVGAFAALTPGAVLARFGPEGRSAHRLARGLDEPPPQARAAPPELVVHAELDPPVDRVDAMAFTAKALADELHARLAAQGSTSGRVVVDAESEHGERCERVWRGGAELGSSAAGFAAALADRVRWQLEGWLDGPPARRPTGGIVLLRLAPDEVVPASGRQLDLWGGETMADESVTRAVARLDGLLGTGAVTVPERRGGRLPTEQVVRVPAAAVELRADRVAGGGGPAGRGGERAPWPGALPAPPPTLVHDPPQPVEVTDAEGEQVRVDGRGTISAPPRWVATGGPGSGPGGGVDGRVAVVGWAGPWPADERWWDPRRRRRRARLQVLLADGRALVVALAAGHWHREATHD